MKEQDPRSATVHVIADAKTSPIITAKGTDPDAVLKAFEKTKQAVGGFALHVQEKDEA